MKRPKKRLRKKYSRKLIFDIREYVSQADILRNRFFEAKEGEVFDLSDSDLASVPLLRASDMAVIRKYRLRFSVEIGSQCYDSSKTDEYFCVSLLFSATGFPTVFAESWIFKYLGKQS